jgi:hypothetical protein
VIEITTHVVCDLCLEAYPDGVVNTSPHPNEARRIASDKGWIRQTITAGSKDVCPNCQTINVLGAHLMRPQENR